MNQKCLKQANQNMLQQCFNMSQLPSPKKGLVKIGLGWSNLFEIFFIFSPLPYLNNLLSQHVDWKFKIQITSCLLFCYPFVDF
jgi:hypothetical protein